MGTNYYARPIKQIQEVEKIKSDVEWEVRAHIGNQSSVELDTVIEEWAAMKIKSFDTLHIGKSSAGWQFLFNYNGGSHYKTREELICWLHEVEISDEYNRILTFDEFWNDVVSNRTWNGQPSKLHHQNSNDPSRYLIIDDLEFLDCEFC